MKAAGALVLDADADQAARRAVGQARASLGDASPSFAVLFASAHFFASAEALVAAVAGGGREVESEPAVALWLAADLGPV